MSQRPSSQYTFPNTLLSWTPAPIPLTQDDYDPLTAKSLGAMIASSGDPVTAMGQDRVKRRSPLMIRLFSGDSAETSVTRSRAIELLVLVTTFQTTSVGASRKGSSIEWPQSALSRHSRAVVRGSQMRRM